MHKAPFVFPIVGGRKVEHLLANVEALEISLSPEQIAYLESILPFSLDFPGVLIVSSYGPILDLFKPRLVGKWGDVFRYDFCERFHRQGPSATTSSCCCEDSSINTLCK